MIVTVAQPRGESALLEAARSIRPLIEASADEIERERQLPEPVIEAMAAAGLFTMLVPREHGGGQVDPGTYLRVIEEVSRADGSAGWCLNVGALVGLAAGSLSEDAADAIWGRDSRAFVAGSVVGKGTALVVDGGYQVSGRWSFASGCMQATWLVGFAGVHQGDTPCSGPNGQPETRFAFLPQSACRIVDN